MRTDNPMLTILIPTKNRADFLERLLKYYALQNADYHFMVGDASDSSHAQQIQEKINQMKDRLNIDYYHYPSLSISSTIEKLNDFVDTPYVTLLPDDDFLVVSGLNECVRFLDGNEGYIAANGMAGLFILNDSGPYGNVKDLGDYSLRSLERETAHERLQCFLDNYFVTLFSVHRTKVWKTMWEGAGFVKDVSFAAELVPNCISVLSGNVKQLPVLYLLRQGHDRRYLLSPVNQWVQSPHWQEGADYFYERTSFVLAEQESLPLDSAKQTIKSYFSNYISSLSKVKKIKRPDGLKKVLFQIPVINTLMEGLRIIKLAYLNKKRKLNLPLLLDHANVFYKDFQPIYKLLTQHQ